MTRRRRTVLLVVSVAAAAGITWFALAWSNRGAREASVDEAIARQRRTSGTADDAAALLRPASGVYTYEASGTEHLSLLSTSQAWGATVPATVTHTGDGCWRFRLDYSTNHWQEQRYCPKGPHLVDAAAVQYQSFDFVAFTVGDTIEFDCTDRPVAIDLEARPGTSWRHTCTGVSPARGTRVVSSGTTTFVGRTRIAAAGSDSVATLHYRLERTLSGDQDGTEVIERWYAPDDGLLLKEHHEVTVRSPSPIGDVTYTESGTLTLRSRLVDR